MASYRHLWAFFFKTQTTEASLTSGKYLHQQAKNRREHAI